LKETSLLARVTTWWTILQISLEERLIYRGEFALGTLMRFLPIVTQIFLWSAVFDAAGGPGGQTGGGSNIAGYSYHDFIAYYLLAMITRAFSSMPGLASGAARDIREGTVKKYLIQPIDMLSFLLLYRVAHKLVYYIIAIVPFAVVYFLCRGFFPGWPDTVTMLAFLISLALAFVMGFYLEVTLGLTAFWFLEVSSLLFIYMLLNFFLSGQMFPLDMLPGAWGRLVRGLPLAYMAYFPAAVFLGKIRGAALAWGLVIELVWVLVFVAASRVAFHYGVRRYSAYGG
jgi:ABC-2 type transport system permease protein